MGKKKKNYGPYPLWSQEQDAAITTVMRQTWPDWQAVAVKLGRSYGSVRTRAYILRLRQADEKNAKAA